MRILFKLSDFKRVAADMFHVYLVKEEDEVGLSGDPLQVLGNSF